MENPNGFDELKYYIMVSIEELKKKFDSLEEKVNLWRQQSIAETIEVKTKISTFAGIIAFLVSIAVSVIFALVAR